MKTDEIKKALDCCIKDDCDNCPVTFGNCEHNAMVNALAYINELEAENKAMHKLLEKRKTEKDNLIKTYAECQKENINKFGEKFLKIVYDNHYPLISSGDGSGVGYGMFTIEIEQAVNEAKKEMVGGNNGTD